jgi:hypothetical protein
VGRGARPAREQVSKEERFSKLHCGRCRKPLSQCNFKAVNKGATYWVCCVCSEELRASGGQDSTVVWDCPTAAKGKGGCKCCCAAAKERQVSGGKRPKSRFSSRKKRKWTEQRNNKLRKGDQ